MRIASAPCASAHSAIATFRVAGRDGHVRAQPLAPGDVRQASGRSGGESPSSTCRIVRSAPSLRHRSIATRSAARDASEKSTAQQMRFQGIGLISPKDALALRPGRHREREADRCGLTRGGGSRGGYALAARRRGGEAGAGSRGGETYGHSA